MSSKLELIKKLIALANDNPNENEANSAARRVCKLLIEVNFTSRSASVPKPDIKYNHTSNPTSSPKGKDPFTYYDGTNFDTYYEDFVKRTSEARRKAEEEQKKYESPFREEERNKRKRERHESNYSRYDHKLEARTCPNCGYKYYGRTNYCIVCDKSF